MGPENTIEQEGRLFLLDWECANRGHPQMYWLRVDQGRSITAWGNWPSGFNELWELLQA